MEKVWGRARRWKMQQSLRAGREIDVDEVIVAGKRKSSLAQEQHWFKASQEEMKINVCEQEKEKEKQEKKYMKIGVFVIGQFITIILAVILLNI